MSTTKGRAHVFLCRYHFPLSYSIVFDTLHTMKALHESLRLIVTRKDSRWIALISMCVGALLVLSYQNGSDAFAVLTFSSLSLYKKLMLFSSSFFDFKNTFTTSALTVGLLGIILGGINISLFYTYIQVRGRVLLKSGLYSGAGLFFAFLGVGCAACGAAFLTTILSVFGFGALLTVLPYKGEEIGYLGLLILSIATYSLAKKVTAPNVC